MVPLLNYTTDNPFFSNFTNAYENLKTGIYKQQAGKKKTRPTPVFLHLSRSGMPCFPYMTNLRLEKSDIPNLNLKPHNTRVLSWLKPRNRKHSLLLKESKYLSLCNKKDANLFHKTLKKVNP